MMLLGSKNVTAHRLRRENFGFKTEEEDTGESNSATSLELNLSEKDSSPPKKSRQTINTDVVLLEKPQGSFEYITSPINRAGKTIGSGRMEKGVDLAIGHRQKHKGMSWRASGSRALAILKVMELNGNWQQIWFSPTA